ncbi:HEAT repeat domain-containing protein [Streptomyces sp. H10-C2]|uniref:HEAT repeat domain-containing protein n=1 Tax=unclassified Streptomyces TaxID=2593676 RepID=UPI0024B8CCBD|nr:MULTISPECIES: HEAT repeat domain-containing protein [unclassified Streptomyces]MDJ0343225.1 HEAT repeat domain-containing protein [Streptomyces sp. PH10-H1]MDJ0370642.1 HEAT repeat domain-containing protein [Streptomyces sp. H10-C2]
MLRGRLGRTVVRRRDRPAPAGVVDPERWSGLCRAAVTGRPDAVQALLDALRAAVDGGLPYDRAAALEALLQAPPELLPQLDRGARRAGGTTPPHRPGGTDPLRLLLASLDRDGHVRQEAVEALTGVGGPLAAAALSLRTVDWVPAVRERAMAALPARTAPDEVAAALRLMLRLGGRRRAGGQPAGYRKVLMEPRYRRAVRALAADRDPRTRRFGMELALELGEYVRGDLLRTALRDRDQVCRRLCAERLLEIDPDQAGRLMWARSAAVRELAVAALPADVPAVRLVAPLADPARMVRAQARWQLYRRGEPPAGVYRRQLGRCGHGSPRLVAGLVAGLGECGDVTDVPLLLRFTDSGPAGCPPRVRRCAVRALGRLARPEDLVRMLAPLALDRDPGVAREVFEALGRVAGEVPAETVWVGRTRTEPAVRRAAERLAPGAGAASVRSSRGTGRGR